MKLKGECSLNEVHYVDTTIFMGKSFHTKQTLDKHLINAEAYQCVHSSSSTQEVLPRALS